MPDLRIIRYRRKAEPVIHTAQAMLDMAPGSGAFQDKLIPFHSDFPPRRKNICAHSKFFGDRGHHYFFGVAGQEG